MQFKDKEAWEKYLAANDNGIITEYGGAAMFFAQHWANLMECGMANGKTLEEIADETSHRADDDMGRYGMSGFTYGAAVSMLAQCWVHGEELRRWHNLKTQIGTEGEKANEKGTVLNPALLQIGE